MNVVGTYRDENQSGKTRQDRKGLKDALEVCKGMKADLIVYSLSRLARNCKDTLEIVEQLQKGGVGLISCKEEFSTTTVHGKLVLTILAAVYEMERESIAERTRDALQWRMEQGIIVSKLLPFGKMRSPKDPKLMIDNPAELKTMRRVVAWHEKGIGLREICRRLDKKAIEPRRVQGDKGRWVKAKWHHNKIRRILEQAELRKKK